MLYHKISFVIDGFAQLLANVGVLRMFNASYGN
jgi:hypothetical protein